MSCNHKKENNKMEIKTNETERTEAFDGVVVIFIMVVLRVVAGVVVIKVDPEVVLTVVVLGGQNQLYEVTV
tara:strand:+ start:269 stop:481 length:213 start_codon:yes stop_codon:yes gene_type:complete